jgi:hypothetical protein
VIDVRESCSGPIIFDLSHLGSGADQYRALRLGERVPLWCAQRSGAMPRTSVELWRWCERGKPAAPRMADQFF